MTTPRSTPRAGADRRLERGVPRLLAARLVVLAAFVDLFAQFPVVAPHARALGASAWMTGVIAAAYSAANLFGNLLAGFVLDRMGRRVPIAVGLAGVAASLGGYALAASPAALLGARLAHGLMAAPLTPGAFAVIGDETPSARRGRAMGTTGALIALAAIASPPLAGELRDRAGAGAVFLAVAGIALAAIGPVMFARRAGVGRRDAAIGHEGEAGSSAPLSARPSLALACAGGFALTLGVGTLVAHLPVLLDERGLSARRIGLAFALYALAAAVAMLGPTGRLSDRIGRLRPAGGGLVVLALGLATLAAAEFGSAFAPVGLIAFGLGFGVAFPALTAMVADAVPRARRGFAYGVFYATYSGGVVCGSLAAGALASVAGVGSPLVFAPAAAGVALVGAVLARRHRRGN